MKKNKLLKTILIIVAIPAVLIGSLTVYAVAKGTTVDEYVFAIKALGSCATGQECMNYCERFEHLSGCMDLAIKYFPNLYAEEFTSDERAGIQKTFRAIKDGVRFPGNSTTITEYHAYCRNPVHVEECDIFSARYYGVEGGL